MKIRGDITKTTSVSAATTAAAASSLATTSVSTAVSTTASHYQHHHQHHHIQHHQAATAAAAAAVAAAAAASNSPSAFKYYTQFLNSIPHFSDLKPCIHRARSSRCSHYSHHASAYASTSKLGKSSIEANATNSTTAMTSCLKKTATSTVQIESHSKNKTTKQPGQLYGRVSCSVNNQTSGNEVIESAESNSSLKKLSGIKLVDF